MTDILTVLAVIPFLTGIFYRIAYPSHIVYNDFKKIVLSYSSLTVLCGMLLVFTTISFLEGKTSEGAARGIITVFFFYFYKDEFASDTFFLLRKWGIKGGLVAFILFCAENLLFLRTVTFLG